jgi:C-terminal processing protease CtpA/Prc
VYAAGWFLPYGILHAQNMLTGATASSTYQSDVNLDGVYDAKDRLSTKSLFCLVSAASFSCSNFLASVLRDSDQVRLLGRKTRGGSCIVQYLSLADGTLFQTSGNRQLASVKNGAYQNIDDGVAVDYTIANLADFYNREALTAKLDALY